MAVKIGIPGTVSLKRKAPLFAPAGSTSTEGINGVEQLESVLAKNCVVFELELRPTCSGMVSEDMLPKLSLTWIASGLEH